MRPRSFNRGNMPSLAPYPLKSEASMRPRSFNRGNAAMAGELALYKMRLQ